MLDIRNPYRALKMLWLATRTESPLSLTMQIEAFSEIVRSSLLGANALTFCQRVSDAYGCRLDDELIQQIKHAYPQIKERPRLLLMCLRGNIENNVENKDAR